MICIYSQFNKIHCKNYFIILNLNYINNIVHLQTTNSYIFSNKYLRFGYFFISRTVYNMLLNTYTFSWEQVAKTNTSSEEQVSKDQYSFRRKGFWSPICLQKNRFLKTNMSSEEQVSKVQYVFRRTGF